MQQTWWQHPTLLVNGEASLLKCRTMQKDYDVTPLTNTRTNQLLKEILQHF
jgi:hypothetical protein